MRKILLLLIVFVVVSYTGAIDLLAQDAAEGGAEGFGFQP